MEVQELWNPGILNLHEPPFSWSMYSPIQDLDIVIEGYSDNAVSSLVLCILAPNLFLSPIQSVGIDFKALYGLGPVYIKDPHMNQPDHYSHLLGPCHLRLDGCQT